MWIYWYVEKAQNAPGYQQVLASCPLLFIFEIFVHIQEEPTREVGTSLTHQRNCGTQRNNDLPWAVPCTGHGAQASQCPALSPDPGLTC